MTAYPVSKAVNGPARDEQSLDDPDVHCAAKLMMDQHGEAATMFAAGRVDEVLEEGDIDGSAVWRRILAAIEELRRGRREDETAN